MAKNAIDTALSRPKPGRATFFSEVRAAFRSQIGARLGTLGVGAIPDLQLGHTNFLKARRCIELGRISTPYERTSGLDFCNSYGHGDHSLKALVSPRGISALPSFEAMRRHLPFCIGNLLCGVANTGVEIEVVAMPGVTLAGYAADVSSRKRKSYLALLGVQFERDVLEEFERPPCSCDFEDLDEIVIQAAYQYPPLYICRRCGQLHTCTCFDGQFDIEDDLVRHLPYGGSETVQVEAVKNLKIRAGICSLCTGAVPPQKYGSSMYFSGFMQSYYPYHRLFSKRMFSRNSFAGDDIHKQVENAVRERFGYPKIGERWLSETLLFRVVERLCAPLEVIHHYRGKELDGLELDIWIPKLRLGIEYQGEQHYKEISAWGGAEGLKKRKANDQKKKALCREAGYHLVEFTYSEKLSEELVGRRLSKFLGVSDP